MCRDCNTSFVWTAGQQSYYRERGFEHASVTPTLSLLVPGCSGGSSCFCGWCSPRTRNNAVSGADERTRKSPTARLQKRGSADEPSK